MFGINAEDNGNHWDPDDWGTLDLLSTFDISAPAAQTALADMCDDIKEESWYNDRCVEFPENDKLCRLTGELCPMRTFKHWVQTECANTRDDE